MIKSVRLTQYRQYDDRKFDFGSGLIAIRGNSEAGKSTIIEAIAYALFGSRMLRDSVADVVNYEAKKASAMKVVVEIIVNNVTYTVSRGKTGAEILHGDDSVTGQNECSQFMEKLLHIPKGRVTELLIAGQNDVQGILKQGSTALAVTIEQLAGFDQVDDLIDRVKAKYPSGALAPLETQLADLKTRQEELPAAVDYTEEIDQLNTDQAENGTGLAKVLNQIEETKDLVAKAYVEIKRLAAVSDEAASIQSSRNKVVTLKDDVTRAKDRLDVINLKLQDEQFLGLGNSDEILDVEIAERARELQRLNDYKTFFIRPKVSQFYKGNKKAFADEFAELVLDVSETKEIVRKMETAITIAESKINLDDNCNSCGQSLDNAFDVHKLNQEQTDFIDLTRKQIKEQQALLSEAALEQATLERIQDEGREVEAQLYKVEGSDNFSIEREVCYPPEVLWVGGEIPEGIEAVMDKFSDQIDKLTAKRDNCAALTAAEAALNAKHKNQTTLLSGFEQALQTLEMSLAESKDIDLDSITKQKADVNTNINRLSGVSNTLQQEQAAFDTKIKQVVARREEINTSVKVGAATVAEIEKQITTVEKQIEEMSFGANLVKTVRDARVKVANQLWSVVLATVSSYFTTMRGIPTVVTKTAKGFKVNDKSLESLSGSTKDICGVALRLALIQLFLPATDFAIFDEAAAGCDDGRTSAVTGFLMGSGFEQTFLITHKNIDEGAANQLIVLEKS